jgi:putative Ca2+/H+ antiporter (TMEM165/GDT1 family)
VHAFLLATFLVFIAEMGDKTQLVALAFATRFRAATVVAGVFLATFVIHLGSVALGEAAARVLPIQWIQIASGIAFILFGAWTLRGDELDDEEQKAESRFGPLMTVAVTFFLAELGDKTMLMTVTIASEQRAFVPVWLGSTVGMVLADGLAIIVGKVIGKELPAKAIRYGAAIVFFASGIWTLVTAAGVLGR